MAIPMGRRIDGPHDRRIALAACRVDSSCSQLDISSCGIDIRMADEAEQWKVFETSFQSSKEYENPFMDVQVDVVFGKDGTEWKQPAFWNGGKTWTVRFAFPETGTFTYRIESNDPTLSRQKGTVDVEAYEGISPPSLRASVVSLLVQRKSIECRLSVGC